MKNFIATYVIQLNNLIVILVLCAGCQAIPRVALANSGVDLPGFNTIYVVSHGWHTGLVIPGEAIKQQLPTLIQRFPASQYIEFGWGDRGFYQAEKITGTLVLRAIFWPTESVMHVVAVPYDASKYFRHSQVEALYVTDRQLRALTQFIVDSFNRNDRNHLVNLGKGIYGDSQFYQGKGNYYLAKTCNTWTAKGLKSMGMEIFAPFRLTAGSVMRFVQQQHKIP